MKKCRLCQIIKTRCEPIIWENSEFYAVLDCFPNTKGMTLVVSKKHYPSYIFDLSDKFCQKFITATKKVAKILDKKLGVQRTAMVMEGTGINHAHIKLYPLYGLNQQFEEHWSNKITFFNNYKGYITTQLGPKISEKTLKHLVSKIKGNI